MTSAQLVRAALALHRLAMTMPAPVLQADTRRLVWRLRAQHRRERLRAYFVTPINNPER